MFSNLSHVYLLALTSSRELQSPLSRRPPLGGAASLMTTTITMVMLAAKGGDDDAGPVLVLAPDASLRGGGCPSLVIHVPLPPNPAPAKSHANTKKHRMWISSQCWEGRGTAAAAVAGARCWRGGE